MNVTYYSKKSVIKNKLKIVMNKGKTFADILNSNCPKFPEIFLEYKEKSAENVPWTKVKAYKKASRQINLKPSSTYGEVKLPRGKEIDFCKSYDMRFSLNGELSSIFQFGPYYNVYSKDEIKELSNEDTKSLNISYVQENNQVTATWNLICGRSMKIFLQEGDNDWNRITNLSNIFNNEVSNSVKFSTKPCTQYKIQVESYWTEHPEDTNTDTDGTIYNGDHVPYTTSPAGTPTMNLTRDVLKIVDDEENEICNASGYQVKCWKQGANELVSNHNSTNIALKAIVGLTSTSKFTCQGRIEYGEEGSEAKAYSKWTNKITVSYTDSGWSLSPKSSRSSAVAPVLSFVILLNLVILLK